MSKRETPLTRRYWKKVGGTLMEEFMAVPLAPDQGRRLIDGVIIEGGLTLIASGNSVSIKGKNIIAIQTKATRLSMTLLGQAILSAQLLKRFRPANVRSVAICTRGDAVLEPLAIQYGVEVVIYHNT
jgi:hypothetical protein